MGDPQNSFIGTSLNVSLFLGGLCDENRCSQFFGGWYIVKRHHGRFMEKKIKKTSEGTKSFSNKSEEKTIIVTIVVALVILGALLVNLVFLTPTEKEPLSAIYYLDSEKKLENIPKTVVLGENSTFTLWVGVENQNDSTIDYSVQLKIDNGTAPVNPSPATVIDSFNRTLVNGEVWEFPVTMILDTPGTNRIIFELKFFNGTSLEPEYTGSWVSLSIEAIQP